MGKTEQADFAICFIARWPEVISRTNGISFFCSGRDRVELGKHFNCQLIVARAVQAVEVIENNFTPTRLQQRSDDI